MNRLNDSARAATTPRPVLTSPSSCSGLVPRDTMLCRLSAIDLMGASELLISWLRTRASRCQASRSSSRSVRERSASTSSRWGVPPCLNSLRRTSQRPAPPGNDSSNTRGASPVSASRRASSSAERPTRFSAGRPSSRSPARFTSFNRCSESNAPRRSARAGRAACIRCRSEWSSPRPCPSRGRARDPRSGPRWRA